MIPEEKKESFFSKGWNGRVKLWQAIVIVFIGGFFATFVLSLGVGAGLLSLSQSGIIGFNTFVLTNFINAAFLLFYGTYAGICLWRTASNPKGSVQHALTRILSILVIIYAYLVAFRFISA